MSDIKKEVEQFLGNQPLFTRDMKKRMVQEITSKEKKKNLNLLLPSLTLLFVCITAILTFTIIKPSDSSPSTSTPEPTPTIDEPVVMPSETYEEEEIFSLIQDEEAEMLKQELERLSHRYFLCSNCHSVEENFISNTTIDWDSHRNLYIEFPDGYRYEENKWNYIFNVYFSELINYGFTDKGKETYQLVFHAITKENDAFNIQLQFQKEKDKWLISHLKDQKIKPKVILEETERNQRIDYSRTAGMYFILEQHGERMPKLENDLNELLEGKIAYFGFENMLKGAAINEDGVVVVEFEDLRGIVGAMTTNESRLFYDALGEVIRKYPEIKEVYFTLNGSFTAWTYWLEGTFEPIRIEGHN